MKTPKPILAAPNNILLALCLIITAIYSCNETPPGPTASKPDYLHFTIGNYWIFSTYAYDYWGNIVSETTMDSLVVVGQQELLGNKAFILYLFSGHGIIDTFYMFSDQTEAFQIFDNIDIGFDVISRSWLKIADFEKRDWHQYDTSTSNYRFVFQQDTVVAALDLTINGSHEYTDTITVENKRYYAYYCYFKIDSRLIFPYNFTYQVDSDTGTVTVRDSVTVKRFHLQYKRYWFEKNIGIIRMQDEPSMQMWSTQPVTPAYPAKNYFNNGRVWYLLRYYVKAS